MNRFNYQCLSLSCARTYTSIASPSVFHIFFLWAPTERQCALVVWSHCHEILHMLEVRSGENKQRFYCVNIWDWLRRFHGFDFNVKWRKNPWWSFSSISFNRISFSKHTATQLTLSNVEPRLQYALKKKFHKSPTMKNCAWKCQFRNFPCGK